MTKTLQEKEQLLKNYSDCERIRRQEEITREIPKYVENCISERDCSRMRSGCSELIEQKLKNTVLSLKLWITVSVLTFLIASGTTFVCAVRSVGHVEEKVQTIEKTIDTSTKQIEYLREEIWKIIRRNGALP